MDTVGNLLRLLVCPTQDSNKQTKKILKEEINKSQVAYSPADLLLAWEREARSSFTSVGCMNRKWDHCGIAVVTALRALLNIDFDCCGVVVLLCC